jgi:hypothetical protein
MNAWKLSVSASCGFVIEGAARDGCSTDSPRRAPGRKQAASPPLHDLIAATPDALRERRQIGSGLSEKIVSSTLCATGLAAERALGLTIRLKGFFTLIQGYTRIGYSQASALR